MVNSPFRWIAKQFQKFNLVPDYFRAFAKEWLNIIFGETLVGIAFLLWWSLANPPNSRLILVFVVALFVAGYFAWRSAYMQLLPGFAIQQSQRHDARTLDGHYSAYFQLLPKCFSVNVEACVGFLTSIEMLDGITEKWSTVEVEALPLQWSYGDEKTAHLPITLYSGAEQRLNVFFINSVERRIRPCVYPFPLDFIEKFDPMFLVRVSAIKFGITLKGKDCSDVRVAMIVNRTGDTMNPTVSVEPITRVTSAAGLPSRVFSKL